MSEKEFTIAGLSVEDADKPLDIVITKRDVLYGNTKDPTGCAAARCIARMPYVEEVRVHLTRTYIKTNGKWTRYQTPVALRQEIVSFDRGGTFQPGDYELQPISEWHRSKRGEGHSESAPPGKPYNKRKSHRKAHKLTGIRHDALRK